MSSLTDILRSVKNNKQQTAPVIEHAAPVVASSTAAGNPLQALLDTSKTAKPASGIPAVPHTANDVAQFNLDGMQTAKQAVAVADPTVHTAVSAASFRYVEQAEAATDMATRELWTAMNTVAASLVASNTSGRDEGIAGAIGSVLRHLQAHPQLAAVLLPEDIGQMTRALEASYSVTIVKKAEGKRKASGKAAGAVADDATMANLAALGFNS